MAKRRLKPKTLLLSEKSLRSIARVSAALALHGFRGDRTTRSLEQDVQALLKTLREMS